jgi:hypothetical protein
MQIANETTLRELIKGFEELLRILLDAISWLWNKLLDMPIKDLFSWGLLIFFGFLILSILYAIFNILKGLLLGFKGKDIEKQDTHNEALKFGYKIGRFLIGEK